MAQLGNRLVHVLTRALHRLYPRMPVVDHWPGTARVTKRLMTPLRRPILRRLAVRHRQRLKQTTFIGIVGSAGKTMTKRMSGAVLSSRYVGSVRRGTANYEHSTVESVLMARPFHRFCVVELSAGGGPGSLRGPLEVLKPTIGVVTCIGTDHYSAFGSKEAIAGEKGRLIRELPENGVAVLNADDPLVIAMRAGCRAEIISFGLAAEADVRAESVQAAWPDRLSFDLIHNGDRIFVQTQLCGTQWVPAALAAAAVGLAMKIPLADIAGSLQGVEPYEARMSPLVLPDGVTFMRDDWKASMHTIPPALEFLRAARASRKIAVIGTISDYSGSSRAQYVRTAKYALEVSDLVVFVGPRASAALRARPEKEPERLRAFATVKTANAFFSSFLKAGDLVLLKGSNTADHLYRIALSRTSLVSCWRGDCRKLSFCNSCELVDKGSQQEDGEGAREHAFGDGNFFGSLLPGTSILVGLGNPGDKYSNTPHNVGYAVLDNIVAETRTRWTELSGAMVAPLEWQGIPLCLVKLKVAINLSGRVLYELLEQSEIDPRQVVLVFDDHDLPLGKVRTRLRGSDGGHRGVRSILEAFQTDELPRIKIGVRRALEPGATREAVLQPFDENEQVHIASAIEQACRRLPELVRSGSSTSPARAASTS